GTARARCAPAPPRRARRAGRPALPGDHYPPAASRESFRPPRTRWLRYPLAYNREVSVRKSVGPIAVCAVLVACTAAAPARADDTRRCAAPTVARQDVPAGTSVPADVVTV